MKEKLIMWIGCWLFLVPPVMMSCFNCSPFCDNYCSCRASYECNSLCCHKSVCRDQDACSAIIIPGWAIALILIAGVVLILYSILLCLACCCGICPSILCCCRQSVEERRRAHFEKQAQHAIYSYN